MDKMLPSQWCRVMSEHVELRSSVLWQADSQTGSLPHYGEAFWQDTANSTVSNKYNSLKLQLNSNVIDDGNVV